MMNYSEEANNCDKNLMTDTGMVALCSHSCHIRKSLLIGQRESSGNNGTANNDTHSKGYIDKALRFYFYLFIF